MKKFSWLLTAICIAGVLFSSCSKKNETANMIPADAMFVAHANIESMGDKLSWSQIKETAWFKKGYGDTSRSAWEKKLLDNPETSGIQFDKGLTFFATKRGESFYLVVEGFLKNATEFSDFNKNFGTGKEVTKNGDLQFLQVQDAAIVGWSDKRFAYVMNTGTTPAELPDFSPVQYQQTQATSPVDLTAYCTSLFNLKSDSSLAKNEHFTDLLGAKGDIHIWQNTHAIMNTMPVSALSMLKLDVFFKDNYSATTINFEKGKIEADSKQYTSKELMDFINKNKGSKINMDMARNIPSNDIAMLFAANFKPGALQEFIKLTGADGFVNMYLQQAGFSLDDLSKANNGDMLLALADIRMKQDSVDMQDSEGNVMNRRSTTRPDMNVLFSMSVQDKASFQKIVDAGKKLAGGIDTDTTVAMVLTDKYFAAGNSKTFVNNYLSGGKQDISFLDDIKGSPIGAFIDLQKMMNMGGSDMITDSSTTAMLNASKKMWKNAIVTGGDTKGGALTFHGEVNLVDGEKSSLQQLNQYLDQLFVLNEQRMKQMPEARNLDSLLTPPPMDTVNVP